MKQKAYAAAGVDIDLGNRVKATLPQLLASTHRREVLGKVGGFGREAVPYLRDGNYDAALMLMTRRVADVIAKDSGVTLSNSVAAPLARVNHNRRSTGPSPLAIIIFLIFLFILISNLFKRGGGGRRGGSGWWVGPMIGGMMGGGGGFGGGGFGGGSGAASERALVLVQSTHS